MKVYVITSKKIVSENNEHWIVIASSDIREAVKQIPKAEECLVTFRDVWDENDSILLLKIKEAIEQYPEAGLYLLPKHFEQSKKRVPFSYKKDKMAGYLSEEELCGLHIYSKDGLWIKGSLLQEYNEFYQQYGSYAFMTFLLEMQMKYKVAYLPDFEYEQVSPTVGEKTFFEGVYERDWYEESICFWKTYLDDLLGRYGKIPLFVQYQAAFHMDFMVFANLDNLNKHLYEGNEAEQFLWRIGEIYIRIEDSVIADRENFVIAHKRDTCIRWVYFILKYRNNQLEYSFYPDEEGVAYGYNGFKLGLLKTEMADIQFMDYRDGTLTIEGRVSPIVAMNQSTFGIEVEDSFVAAELTERYAHIKAFGMTIYKRYAFTIHIPLSVKEQMLRFVTKGTWGKEEVTLDFDSHFSRITNRFVHSYWRLTPELVMYPKASAFYIKPQKNILAQELRLWFDMLKTRNKKIIKYIPVRAFLLCKPLLKHHPIWMFMDKIYKGGDSSEYIYRYAEAQKDGIKKYYLVDPECSDRKRLEADGYRPLLRRSLKHRLIFLYADMIIISNSTVYAFNDFGTKNSAYIRDLMNFHTVCVQHGMSVQKIAIAQNRLRDNIRLYFCASKYEIENLSRPVYGYDDRRVLQLTGVPRYDGLIDNRRKQIMISPTWRMQAAVPVSKNEGVARDYNPLFKETSYYKVYNSLINDKRLIEAAKRYGYRIVYVLHPIVSPQVEDFDKNDYVDIVPSTGDMSYEKMFCESSLMVTDFSGIQFDFAYMRKPLIYLHHKDIPQHYEEGTFYYDTMAFGEICHDNDELIDLLCEYMRNDCVMKPEYVRRADDFFAFNDHNNCERIYNVMSEYQRNGLSLK